MIPKVCMITPRIFMCLIMALFSHSAFASTSSTKLIKASTPFIFYDANALNKAKLHIASVNAHPHAQKAFDNLISSANTAMQLLPLSVTNKTSLTASQNKHDYVSLSRYWWPNPDTDNGLPWIRKDGITNPTTQSGAVDRPRLGKFSRAIEQLSLAYFFTDDERYAQHASALIQTWFLNPNTYMTPHLEYAQRVPGIDKGRRSGILDGRLIPQYALDAVSLIASSKHWQEQHNEAFKLWLSRYLTWLTSSKLGKHAATSQNNHGSWYHYQVISIAHYLGRTNTVLSYAKRLQQLINTQINAEGLQRFELDRSRTYFYSAFNLQALSRSAIILQTYNINLWDFVGSEGGSMLAALDYMLQFLINDEKWPYRHIEQNTAWLLPIILRASLRTSMSTNIRIRPPREGQPNYETILKTVNAVLHNNVNHNVNHNVNKKVHNKLHPSDTNTYLQELFLSNATKL